MEVAGQFGGGGEGRPLEKVTFDCKFEDWEGASCVEFQAEGRTCAKALRLVKSSCELLARDQCRERGEQRERRPRGGWSQTQGL